MLCLNISSQNAKIDFNIIKPQMELKTTQPQIQISTEAAKVEISQPKGQLEIDQSPCRASLGLKNWTQVAMDVAEAGRSAFYEAIGNMAEEGDRIAAIEKEPDAIVNIAVEKTTSAEANVEIGWIENPIISYRMNPPEYNAVQGKVDVQLQRGTVENNFQWGRVNIGMAQYQSIKFWTTENKWDMYV